MQCEEDKAAQTNERRIQAMNRLVGAVQELSLARSLETVTSIVRKVARELTGSDGATFILRDVDKCHYVDEDAIGPLWKGQRFPMTACVSGWAMLNKRPAVIPDIFDDSRVPVDAYRPTFVKSLVMVPIRTDQPIGAIGTYWSRPYRASHYEVELLQNLAHTTALALENVKVYSELEQRVQERTRELQAANEALEAFSYSVSHDLRSPITTVNGCAILAEMDLGSKPSAEIRDYLKTIQSECIRMGALITDLLQLAESDRVELNKSIVDISQLGQEIFNQLAAVNSTRQVDFRCAPGLQVCADAGLLRTVLDNLIGNAWKYSSKRAHASIELGQCITDDHGPAFFVRDNGAGFDEQKAAQLFTPFHRLHTRNEFPGTGVGLASARRIIERHGGRIWAKAAPDEGATFYFTLG
ncbi:MAG: ATP-binding protein [Nibricoccus sp.]